MDAKPPTSRFSAAAVDWWFVLCWGFCLGIALIQAGRNRSFWLDEAYLYSNLLQKTPWEILFGGPLLHLQQCPKFFLAATDVLTGWLEPGRFWPRFLPLLFQLAGIGLWLEFYRETFWKNNKSLPAFMAAAGLLVSSSYTLYYTYEFKPYSADFFFTGAAFYLFSSSLPAARRLRLLAALLPLSLLFSYPAAFSVAAVALALACDPGERKEAAGQKSWLLASAAAVLLVGGFNYFTDYRFGLAGKSAEPIRKYWEQFFITGPGLQDYFSSFLRHSQDIVLNWWRTDQGPMNEHFARVARIPFLPLPALNWPSVRLLAFVFVLAEFLAAAYKVIRGKARRGELLAVFFIAAMLAAAVLRLYPYGHSRLTLFFLPVSAFLLVSFFSRLHRRLPYLIVWLPIFAVVARNALFLGLSFSRAPYVEDAGPALREIYTTRAKFLVAAKGNSLMLSGERLPPDLVVLYEDSLGAGNIIRTVGRNNFYYAWSHALPERSPGGTVKAYEKDYTERPVLRQPDGLVAGLLLLSPRR